VHTRSGEHIRLPTTEGRYANDATCYWVIMAPANKAIRLHWISFEMEETQDCSFDYVEIYDSLSAQLGDDKAKPMAKYCGTRLPEDLVSHSRQLVIKFASDYSEADGGLELTYTFEDRDNCGGHIHASSGELTSPDYPANYSSGLHCDWKLTGAIGHLLEIQVENFELEPSPNCTADYLEIRNGGDAVSPLIGRFCGQSIPTRIPSFSHEMRLILHTDAAINGRGFRLRWRVFALGCGGQLRSNMGLISTPRYPNSYPHYSHCEWRIILHPGSAISLLIEDMDVESLSSCYYDSVKIYSGIKMPNQSPEKVLCGEQKNELIQLEMSEATIAFDSDSSNSGRGFRISFKANCVRNLTATTGTIESLNYMEPFMETIPINCSWTIRAPRGNHIRIEVSHLERHEEHMPSTQMPGGLYIVDGGHVQKISTPMAVNVSGEVLTVVHNASYVNFQLDYRIDGCLEELRGESGSFQSPNHPNMYPNDLECYWLITVQRDSVVELTIFDIDLEESVNCTKDALSVSLGIWGLGIGDCVLIQ